VAETDKKWGAVVVGSNCEIAAFHIIWGISLQQAEMTVVVPTGHDLVRLPASPLSYSYTQGYGDRQAAYQW